VLPSTTWSKEANSLFLYKLNQQGQYLATATSYPSSDNRSLSHAKGWLYVAQLFPEFVGATTWQTNARTLLFNALDGQFYNDGSHVEQSPGYASRVAGGPDDEADGRDQRVLPVPFAGREAPRNRRHVPDQLGHDVPASRSHPGRDDLACRQAARARRVAVRNDDG
jgi:hypothetical protein